MANDSPEYIAEIKRRVEGIRSPPTNTEPTAPTEDSPEYIEAIKNRVQSMSSETPQPSTTTTTPKKGFVESMKEDAGATIGSTAGGIIGSMLGPTGERAGEFIGGTGGDIYQQQVEQGGVPPIYAGGGQFVGYQEPKGKVDLKQALTKGGIETLGGEVGRTAFKGIRKLATPYGRQVKEGAGKALAKMKEFGGDINTAQLTESWFPDIMQNVAKTGLFGGSEMAEYSTKKQKEPIKRIVDNVIEGIGKKAPPDEMYLLTQDAIKGGRQVVSKIMGEVYREVDKLTGAAKVDTSGVLKIAQEILRTEPTSGGGEAARLARKYLDELEGIVSFERAHIEQSDLFDIPKGKAIVTKGVDKANQARLRNAWIKSMSKAAQDLDPEGYRLWRAARDMYKDKMKPYNSNFVARVLNTEGGGKALKNIFPSKEPGLINKLHATIRNPKQWQDLKASWLEDMVQNNVQTKPAGEFKPRKFLDKIGELGDGAYKAIFDKAERKELDQLIEIIDMVEEKTLTGKLGIMMIQMKQAGALATLGGVVAGGTGAGAGAAVGILAVPKVFAKILTSPKMTRYLTNTLKFPEGSEAAAGAMGRLVAAYVADEKKESMAETTAPIAEEER